MLRSLRTLRGRLLLLLALALLPPGAFALMQAVASYDQARTLYERSALQEALLAIASLEPLVSDARKRLSELAAQPEIRRFDPATCAAMLAAAATDVPSFLIVSAVDTAGDIRCLSRPSAGRVSVRERDWYAAFIADPRFYITPAQIGLVTRERVIGMNNPMFDDAGAYAGFVRAAIPTKLLEEELSRIETGENAYLALVDRDGQPIAASGEDASWMPPPAVVRRHLGAADKVFKSDEGGGAVQTFAVASFYEKQVFALAGIAPPRPLAGLSLGLALDIALPTIMWGAALLVAWYGLDRYVVRWIVQLRRIAQAYSKGRLTLRAIGMESAPLELRQLGDTMNEMAATLDERADRLRASVAEQQALLAEVHHRVKNNLQLMSSLVNLQYQRAELQAERDSLRIVQERIHALALVHRGLYEQSGVHRLDLGTLVPELVRYIQHGRSSAAQMVSVGYDIAGIEVDANKAVPTALLITEAVSDAFDRAAPGRCRGRIVVRIAEDDEGSDILVAVEGIQAPWSGLARLLVEAFAQQLKGSARFDVRNGTSSLVVRTARLSTDPVPA